MTYGEQMTVVVPFYNEEKMLEDNLQRMYDLEPVEGADFLYVDNGSTDDSRGVIQEFKREHEDFPLTVVEEPEKGTGAAADTGFQTAIDRGARLIARTDADTLPRHDWIRRIDDRFESNNYLKLLGGTSLGLKDEYYRRGDDLMINALVSLGRVAMSVQQRSLTPMVIAVGHNMATTADAYAATGGFPRTNILEVDEDKVYTARVAEMYGVGALMMDNRVVVESSVRRLRAVGGLTKLFSYYYKNDPEERLQMVGGNIDVR